MDDLEKNDLWDGGLLVWHIKYQHFNVNMLEEDLAMSNITKNSRLRHRLEIKKDDVQMVLPISKVREILFMKDYWHYASNILSEQSYLHRYIILSEHIIIFILFLALGVDEHRRDDGEAGVGVHEGVHGLRVRLRGWRHSSHIMLYYRRCRDQGNITCDLKETTFNFR